MTRRFCRSWKKQHVVLCTKGYYRPYEMTCHFSLGQKWHVVWALGAQSFDLKNDMSLCSSSIPLQNDMSFPEAKIFNKKKNLKFSRIQKWAFLAFFFWGKFSYF